MELLLYYKLCGYMSEYVYPIAPNHSLEWRLGGIMSPSKKLRGTKKSENTTPRCAVG